MELALPQAADGLSSLMNSMLFDAWFGYSTALLQLKPRHRKYHRRSLRSQKTQEIASATRHLPPSAEVLPPDVMATVLNYARFVVHRRFLEQGEKLRPFQSRPYFVELAMNSMAMLTFLDWYPLLLSDQAVR
jgi:hypothetical protein